jgi:hypothetical protein
MVRVSVVDHRRFGGTNCLQITLRMLVGLGYAKDDHRTTALVNSNSPFRPPHSSIG